MNYTQPDDPNHTDSPEDWLAGMMIFGRALGVMLKEEGQGIVVKLVGDVKDYFEDDHVIVYNTSKQIKVIPTSDLSQDAEFEEGQFVKIYEHGDE